jgi:hypothetical protein
MNGRMNTHDASTPEDGSRVCTMDSRYQVGDDCCGMVDSYRRKAAAIGRARSHRDRHRRDNDPREVKVTDRMHRRHRSATVFVASPEGETRRSSAWQ